MITYSNIGHFGRLGNQLFQIAATLGIARKLGYEVKFPIENMTTPSIEHFKDGKILNITFDVPKAFIFSEHLLAPKSQINAPYLIRENQFHFNDSFFKILDGSDLSGYFQSEKYFLHVENELRTLLTFKAEISERARMLFPKVPGRTVSIHMRRGDYVYQQEFHPVCDADYYLQAANLFRDEDTYFIIFSDDIDYCKTIFVENENIIYTDNSDPYVDMCLMSMCDHNIIANSSFSWWAAWLNNNQNKKVIAPKKWFGIAYQHNTADLYCSNWITL